MKGVTHFLSGVAVASCFPTAVESVFQAKSFLLPLGGAFGVLPDTLDFRFARYIWDYQHVVRIDETNLDPKIVAEKYAAALDEASQTGKMVTLRLDIIRISANYYRTYLVYVDDRAKEVTAIIGPLKTMSQVMEKLEHMPPNHVVHKMIEENGVGQAFEEIFKVIPCLPESTPPGGASHTARFTADVENTYYQETEVGIFSGPDFAFMPRDGKIRIDFIPWHRTWAHSLTLGLLMGPLAFALYASWGDLAKGNLADFATPCALTAGAIAILAFWAHIFEDQLGHLGSNLFYPFTKDRSIGMKLTTAASPHANIMTNWLAFTIIIWNLNAHAPTPAFTMHWAQSLPGGFADWTYYLVSLVNYVVYVMVLPPVAVTYLAKFFSGSGTGSEYDGEDTFEVAGYAGDQGDA